MHIILTGDVLKMLKEKNLIQIEGFAPFPPPPLNAEKSCIVSKCFGYEKNKNHEINISLR